MCVAPEVRRSNSLDCGKRARHSMMSYGEQAEQVALTVLIWGTGPRNATLMIGALPWSRLGPHPERGASGGGRLSQPPSAGRSGPISDRSRALRSKCAPWRVSVNMRHRLWPRQWCALSWHQAPNRQELGARMLRMSLPVINRIAPVVSSREDAPSTEGEGPREDADGLPAEFQVVDDGSRCT